MYFTLIMFNMMGYVVHQYHGALGVDQDAKAGPAAGAKEESGAEAIGRLVGAGQIDQALELAYEEQRIAPENLAVQQRYHKLLQLAPTGCCHMAHATCRCCSKRAWAVMRSPCTS
jgi:hypothetical protein